MKSKFAKRMTQLQKTKMRDMYRNQYALAFIARKFKCHINTVWNNVFDLSTTGSDNDASFTLSEARKRSALNTSKLTTKKVMLIRSLYHKNSKKHHAVALAKKFNVNQTTILGIVRGRTFRWLGGWTKPFRKEPDIYLKPSVTEKTRGKTNKMSGPKLGSKMGVSNGILLKVAKKVGLSPSRVSQLRKKGELIFCPICGSFDHLSEDKCNQRS